MGAGEAVFAQVGRFPLWSMCAWESTTASIEGGVERQIAVLGVRFRAPALV